MADPRSPVLAGQQVALVELVNRVLDRGVVVTGDITISVADVDLLYLGVRLLLSSVDPAHSNRRIRRAEAAAALETTA